MLPFGQLHRMMVVRLMIATFFCINSFAWNLGVYQIISPVTTEEGKVLEFNLHFRAIFGEFLQTHKVTTNSMKSRTVDDIDVGPSGSFQDGIRCFSLASGKILHCAWKDVDAFKMLINSTRGINYVPKKYKIMRGIKFSYSRNILD